MSDQGLAANVLPSNTPDIMYPEGMALMDLHRLVVEYVRAAEGDMLLSHTFNVLPFEGALALKQALEEVFGRAWASDDNAVLTLEVEPGVNVAVPWGDFSVPGVEGSFETRVSYEDGRYSFRFLARLKRKFEPAFRQVAARVEEILQTQRIYKGKVFEVKFRDGDGDLIALLQPKPMVVANAQMPIYSRHVEKRIEAEVLSVLRNYRVLQQHNIPIKKGILFTGTYGTGKTMLARHIARIAKENGWTFIYVPHASEFADGYQLAKGYQPAVLFVEDIDSVVGVIRDREVNNILNTIGGIQSKDDQIITVVTTNDLNKVHPAFLRPGRIDHIIDISFLDAEAAERHVRELAQGSLPKGVDLSVVAQKLAGQTGARIEHMVNIAKLYWVNRTAGKGELKLELQDLIDATASTLGVLEENITQQPPEATEGMMFVTDPNVLMALMGRSKNGRS